MTTKNHIKWLSVALNQLKMLYTFFWVISRRLNFICGRFGTLCLFHLHRRVGILLTVCEDGTDCSETSAYNIQTPGNYPEESVQHSEHGESLKSRKLKMHFLKFSLERVLY